MKSHWYLLRLLPKLVSVSAWREALVQRQRLLHLLQAATSRRKRIRLAGAWLRLLAAGKTGDRSTIRVEWDGPAGEVTASVSDLSELRTVSEVFVDRCYETKKSDEPETILDLGANVGIATLYFASRWPNARIVAVEPHPCTYELLERNVGHIPKVETMQAAVTDVTGAVAIFSGTESWAAGLTASQGFEHRDVVPGVTLDDVASAHGLDRVDLLKVDIEGAESAVLTRHASALDRVQRVVFEFHAQLSAKTLWELLDDLPQFEPVSIRGESDGQALVELARR